MLQKEREPSVLTVLRKYGSSVAWSDQEGLLEREGALMVVQNPLGKRTAAAEARR